MQRKNSQLPSETEESKTEKSQSLPTSPVSSEKPQPEVTRMEYPRPRRVGGMKVLLREVEITRGPKGQFVRRLKDILRKTHAFPQKSLPDVDSYEPVVHPVPRVSSISIPHLRKDVHDQSDDED